MLMIQAAQRKLPNALFDWAQQAGCTFTQSPKDWKPSHPSNMTQAESPSALSQLPRSSSSCPHGPHTIRSRKPEALSRHISSLTWAGILGFRARRRASSSRVWLLLRWVPCTVFSLCCLRSIQKALVAQHKGLTKMQMLVFLCLCAQPAAADESTVRSAKANRQQALWSFRLWRSLRLRAGTLQIQQSCSKEFIDSVYDSVI